MPSCLKHDVTYGSLQRFAGAGDDGNRDPDASELDETWNPRNKSLADSKFKADITRYGCQNPSVIARETICGFPNDWMATLYYWAVAIVNDKGWPVASEDLHSGATLPRFTYCLKPEFPTVSNVSVNRIGDTVTVSLNFRPGCVIGISDVLFSAYWEVASHPQTFPITKDSSSCTTTDNIVTCEYDFSHLRSGAVIERLDLFIIPRNLEYGASDYQNLTVFVGPLSF